MQNNEVEINEETQINEEDIVTFNDSFSIPEESDPASQKSKEVSSSVPTISVDEEENKSDAPSSFSNKSDVPKKSLESVIDLSKLVDNKIIERSSVESESKSSCIHSNLNHHESDKNEETKSVTPKIDELPTISLQDKFLSELKASNNSRRNS